MSAVTNKPKRKRPSKGQRKHTRLVKQEARKANTPANNTKTRKRPA